MKKLLLLVAVAVMTAGAVRAQDKPEALGVAAIDTYVGGAFDLTAKKTALSESLDKLEKDIAAAGKLPSKDQRTDFVARGKDIEAGYKSMPDDVKKLLETAKDVTAAAKGCGMKAAKCAKAVKAATEQLTTITTGLTADAPRAAKVEAATQAMAAVTK